MAKICSSRAKPVIMGTASLLSFITGVSIANTFYECNTVNRPYRFLTLFRNKFLHAIYVKGRKKLPLLTTLPINISCCASLARSRRSCRFPPSAVMPWASDRGSRLIHWLVHAGILSICTPLGVRHYCCVPTAR